MVALPHPVLPAGSLPKENRALRYRQADALWLALQLLDPRPDPVALESLAEWAKSLTPVVELRPGEGLLLEVQGSLRYFSGLDAIRQRLTAELGRRGWSYRLATAPTPLAAAWLVRCRNGDIAGRDWLAGALGRLPLEVTAWPESVLRMLGQMGLRSIADCLRLPRSGFARRVGRAWLEELDRALGVKPDPRTPWQSPETLCRSVEFMLETHDQARFAAALSGMTESLERELRQRQAQIASITLGFRHPRASDTLTRIGFIEPVHERDRMLEPLLARIERIALVEPAIALSLETSQLLDFAADMPELLPTLPGVGSVARTGQAVPEFALIERLRGRFGTRSVHGIDSVAEHRPERAWRCRSERPEGRGQSAEAGMLSHGRPLWLLPEPRRKTAVARCRALSPAGGARNAAADREDSEPLSRPERIESGWWDGQDVRRDYHVVVGAAGEKLWCYRDCRTHEWYLHGIFG